MSAKGTLEILQTFTSLKRRKKGMSQSQYNKELILLKTALEEHMRNPNLGDIQDEQIISLLKSRPKA